MKIAIHGKTFLSWGGGVDLLGYFISSLKRNNLEKNKNNQLYLLIPQKSFFKQLEFYVKSFFKKKNELSKKEGLGYLKDLDKELKVIYYTNDDWNDLKRKLNSNQIDVICPTADSLGRNFPLPWIGYIFDLQHKYLPDFFTEREKKSRDSNIEDIINNSNAVLVNSKFVKEDLKKFYGADEKKIFVLPFCPFPRKDWLNCQIEPKVYLPEKFFIISNQFWYHKSHITAFKALKILEDKYRINNIHIICTGKTIDYRQPDFFNNLNEEIKKMNLQDRIHFLGFIDKDEQMVIMKKSFCVIQPTLFEGGPGGGSVYDALSIGIPAIVSDIPVNKEINDEYVTFFKAGDPEDLAEKMCLILRQSEHKVNKEVLTNKVFENEKRFAEKIIEAIEFVY